MVDTQRAPPTEFILSEWMNAEAHVRKLGDSLAEVRAKVAELGRNQHPQNHLQGELPASTASVSSVWRGIRVP